MFKRCKDCVNRTPGCHDICEIYKEDKERYNNVYRKNQNKDIEYRIYQSEGIKRRLDYEAKKKKGNRYV